MKCARPSSVCRNAATMLLAGAAIVAPALVGCQTTTSARSASGARVMTASAQQAMSPAQVVEDLRLGNARFVAGTPDRHDYGSQVRETAGGQHPKAVVLSCIDSRVPPEIVFDQGVGDIFVGRVAGNFENEDLLGGMEYATAVAGAKAIIVLGHSSCGAIKGAIDHVRLGNLTASLENVRPAIEAASAHAHADHLDSHNAPFVQAVAEANVRQTMRDIMARSEVLRERVERGELTIVGAVYDLKTGAVQWLNEDVSRHQVTHGDSALPGEHAPARVWDAR
ncbi:MAG: carbonic anhydrase family protein [Planctomycetota bacterium]|nr:carbonic anhydrase family protein [Planctomycetota bacterium]